VIVEIVTEAVSQAQVWYKELENGDRAVAAYNSGSTVQNIEVDFSDVGFATTTPLKILDLYSKQELQVVNKWLAEDVPSHGVRMLRVSLAV
jgi:alpha-galactosidase